MNRVAKDPAAPKSSYDKLDLETLRFLAGVLEVLARCNQANELLRAELKIVISEIRRYGTIMNEK